MVDGSNCDQVGIFMTARSFWTSEAGSLDNL